MVVGVAGLLALYVELDEFVADGRWCEHAEVGDEQRDVRGRSVVHVRVVSLAHLRGLVLEQHTAQMISLCQQSLQPVNINA